MITTATSGWSFFASSSTCSPSMPGIFRSTIMIDQRSPLSFSIAERPSGSVAMV